MAAGNATQTPQRRARGLVARNTDLVVMVKGPTMTDPLKLEGLARAVWDALDAPRTADEIIALVAERHRVATDELRGEVESTVRMLAAAEIVVDAA